MEDWALIKALVIGQGLSQRAVARQLGVDQGTVGRAARSDRPPKYSPRPPSESIWDKFEPLVRQLLAYYLDLPNLPVNGCGLLCRWPMRRCATM